jgi:hypothetical protein
MKRKYFKGAQRSLSQQLGISVGKTSTILMEFFPLCRDISILLNVLDVENKKS